MAILQGAGERPPESAIADVRSVGTIEIASLARTLVLAAGITAAAELLLQRLAPPILAPVGVPGSRLLETLSSAGELAANGTAVLVFLAVAAFVATRSDHALALAAATAAVLLASWWTAPIASIAAHTLVVAAAAAIGLSGLRGARSLLSLGIGLAALAVVVGQLPLLADTTWPWMSNQMGARSLGELLAIAAALTMAGWLLTTDHPGRRAWVVAGACAVVVAGGLTFQPGFTSLGAIWVVGVTLALPPVFYIAAAAAAGLLVAGWSRSPASRPLAAAVLLLTAAGIQPQVLHHNLTALLALAVLTSALPARQER